MIAEPRDGRPGSPRSGAARRRRLRIGRTLAALVLPLGLLGCTALGPGPTRIRATLETPPVVTLAYQVAEGLHEATGSETITFVPDQQVCEVVLRAWPNKPALTEAGNAMTISRVSVDGADLALDVQAAGARAGEFGTLVEARLPECRDAGAPLTIEADFAITLGPGTDERMGHAPSDDVAWFQTAFPLLAWQAGVGWVRDAAVDMFGETVTSESFVLDDLAVTVPNGLAVAGVGTRGATTSVEGRTTHHFSGSRMRDVSVMVGAFTTIDHSTSGTTVHLSVPPSARLNDADEWHAQIDASLAGLVDYLGPVPYPDVWVNIVPGAHEGIESSGSVQFGGSGRRVQTWLVTHELAHQWVYGLVGNNQAQHPWLDESVTSMIQAVVDHPERSPRISEDRSRRDADAIGQPMSYFAGRPRSDSAYDASVYTAGAQVLLQAREDAGHAAFDAALQDYLDQNADRIAWPEDFADAFRDVPGVLATLGEHNMVP